MSSAYMWSSKPTLILVLFILLTDDENMNSYFDAPPTTSPLPHHPATPTLCMALTSAPEAISALTTSRNPLRLAHMRAVTSLCGAPSLRARERDERDDDVTETTMDRCWQHEGYSKSKGAWTDEASVRGV